MAVFSVTSALSWASAQLAAIADIPHLEAEILLAHTLRVARSYFHAWPERELSSIEQENFCAFVLRRMKGEPIAYIVGYREFWSLNLRVTSDTLIPRPETELLVELVLEKLTGSEVKIIADLGTGSGAIALAIAHEKPHWQVHATDCMPAALAVARENAESLQLKNVTFHEGSWCAALPAFQFDVIVSNPPYIANHDSQLQAQVLQHEPRSALLSGADGLDDIRQLVQQAKNFLKPGAYLFLEHGYQQAESVRQLLKQAGYKNINTHQDLTNKDRVTGGQC